MRRLKGSRIRPKNVSPVAVHGRSVGSESQKRLQRHTKSFKLCRFQASGKAHHFLMLGCAFRPTITREPK